MPILPSRSEWSRMATHLHAPARVRVAQPLADLTTFRIGGPAGLVCPVENALDAQRFLDDAQRLQIPWTCLGGGSNILGDDAGYAGLILLIQSRDLAVHGDRITAGAGWGFDDLIEETLARRLTGLEFASGIPGTAGGALVGNAGCYGHEIGDLFESATVLRPDGSLVTLGPDDFAFAYRTTALKERGDIVLDITLQLHRGDLDAAVQIRDDHLADRRRKHPWDLPCAGSYFKNLPPEAPGGRRRAAGLLLEQIGAKEMREGDAAVFAKHANIIVNHGQARACDVLRLAARMKSAVQEEFGTELEEEVRHLATPDASGLPDSD